MAQNWMLAVFACALAFALAACGGSNDSNASSDGDSDSGGGGGILLQPKFSEGEVIVETSVEASDQNMHFGKMPILSKETKKFESRTEILAVDDKGYPTKARIVWSHAENTKQKNKGMDETLGEARTVASGLDNASILYERAAGEADFKSTLEKGDKENGAVAKNLAKVDPFLVAFIPGRKVKVGDSWDADKDALSRFIGDPGDKMKITEQSAKCKAEELTDDGKTLKVTFDMTMNGKLLDPSLGGDTPFKSSTKGYYLWDVEAGRATKVEMNQKMEFEGESQGNKIVMKQSGTTTKTFSYEKK